MNYVVVLVTVSSNDEGRKIADKVLRFKLAACVNILDGATSMFWWEGSIDEAKESILMIKTHKEKVASLFEIIKREHSYDVPEIIALPIVAGEKEYLQWIEDSVQ